MRLPHFLKPRVANPTGGYHRMVKGFTFDGGAEQFATESIVGDPRFNILVIPQFNFTPLRVYQPVMSFQELSLPQSPLQGYPYGGLLQTGLIPESDYPDVEGNYYS